MFAVIKTGGRQYRVVPDDVLEIGKIAGDVGTIVQLGEVLVVGGDTPVLGMPMVAGASVAAEVLALARGLLPPTINLRAQDPACDLDFVPNEARAVECVAALCNCLGFGSKNSALVLGRAACST